MPLMRKYPFYLKATIVLLGLVLLSYSLYGLREILVPFAFALMLSVLLNPVTNRLQDWKVPRLWSIIIALLLAIIFIGGAIYFLTSQMARFSNELPQLQQKGTQLLHNLQQEINERLNISVEKQNKYIAQAQSDMQSSIAGTLGVIIGSLATILLLPVYTFLFLYYKTLLVNFLYEVFAEKNSAEVGIVLTQTKKAIQSYMIGLMLEAIIVATLNSVALWILGVKYALLLGVLGAVLNILPFIGGILSVALPLIIATVTKDGYQTQIWICVAYAVIQFIDNHFLVPYIVSSRVRVNALISILIVLLGAAVWGVPGMFLSIPFTGILKIIFDRVPELKPWGKLLGDEVPTRHKGQVWNIRRRRKTAT